MSDPNSTSPITGNAGVMYALGELKGQMGAVLVGQQSQAEINAENKREHDSFRTDIAVLKDSRLEAQRAGTNRIQTWMVYLGIPAAVLSSAGVVAWLLINHP